MPRATNHSRGFPCRSAFRFAPAAEPDGPARNVAQAYVRIAEAIGEGKRFDPDFDHALRLHELLEALQQSSDESRAVKMGWRPMA